MRTPLFAVGVAACVAIALSAQAPAHLNAPTHLTHLHPRPSSRSTASAATTSERAPAVSRSIVSTRRTRAAMRRYGRRVVEKLRAGSMPPPGRPRPDAATYHAAAASSSARSIAHGRARPDPGRIGAVHRLNRTEYSNAIRDLFGLDPQSLDVASQLPGDETADGSFDNFADVLSISTAHLERYMSVARQVTRRATALPPSQPVDRHLRDSAACHAGRSAERRSAARIARRHRRALSLSGRRRVSIQGAAAAQLSGLSQRAWDGSSCSTCGSTASC